MKNIAVIGAGNIGRRHLQALTHLDSYYTLFAVDPSFDAINLSSQMYEEAKNNNSPELYLLDNINDLPQELFAVIIACNSEERYIVSKKLFKKNISNIIYEKVLFQNTDEYYEINSILKKRKIKAWVNCWRRTCLLYQNFKKKYLNQKLTSLSVKGSNWGMASNAIHFFDLVNYYTDSTDFKFKDNNIKVFESKREGYYEFDGIIRGAFNSGSSSFTLESNKNDEKLNYEVKLEFEKNILIVKEEDQYWYEKLDGYSSEKHNFEIIYQSEMTQNHIINLVEKGNCDLTPFVTSCGIHLTMIDYFKTIFKKNNSTGCPIT